MVVYQNAKRRLIQKVYHRTGAFFLYTFFWGLLAHAYGFLHTSFSHDGLNAIYIEESESLWKMAIGRSFVDFYRYSVRGKWEVPWLIGIISLAFIAVAAKVVGELFEIDTRFGILFLSGIMVVNHTVTNLTANYIFEMDIDLLAMLLAVLAVYCWRKNGRWWLLGILCICISLGLYQAYLSVTICLILLILLKQILNGYDVGTCFKL